ncbi:gamma-glutamylcyclotransferase [Pseudonocardia kujensis]|uniref:gamma-glutamylcyclotransferase family protein n=1 Tax=Pseudonocardia kujensis TaxID=1128675 RepID=UPI001E632619|nr:gamma-glutamylcyclotransferase [Pseudonocardia kujensis]MCE0766721.1 gamma-glutamylcyclotransferase [Pseudonocardia kujensis]
MPDFPDAAYPAAPYPGVVPDRSFVHVDGGGFALAPDPSARSSWRVGDTDLDAWLAGRGAPPLAARVPLLTYGSNRNPAKIGWLRRELGLGGPVVVLRARTTGLTAVWAHGLRVVDDQRPAVLAAGPGLVEEHSVWFATPEQVAVLDVCEGRSSGRYRLARVRTGEVRTEDGTLLDDVLAYLGRAGIRRPLLVDGEPVRCTDLPQTAARVLRGEQAPSDGLDATTLAGAPVPDSWPARLFVYGTLQPGARSWHLLAGAAAGPAEPVTVPGTLLDTGLGYPAMLRDAGRGVPGHLVPLRDPAALLPRLDRFEGPGYVRVRVATPDGRSCWTYVWTAPTHGFRPVERWSAPHRA